MAAGSTYEAIATQTLSSDTASITFSSIPSTYTDLILVSNGSTNTGTQNMRVQFNGDTGANYARTRLLGGDGAASSERLSNESSMGVGDWGTGKYMILINIQNYANTLVYKTVLSRSSGPDYVSAYVGLWRSNNAITSITFFKNSTNFISGSTFSLYGIAEA